jgi:hypothetical protein
MKNNKVCFFTVIILTYCILSCKKSESDEPLVTVLPKLIKEVKTTETAGGITSVNTLVFDYNNFGQIIRRSTKETPSNYTIYIYNGQILEMKKVFANNQLIEEKEFPVLQILDNYSEIFITSNGSGSNDTTSVLYSFTQNEMSTFRVLIDQPSVNLEMKYQYGYKTGSLINITYTNFMNGIEGSPNTWAVRKLDDKSNPYLNANPMNKVLMSIGQDPLASGKHNILELETTTPANGGTQIFTHTYDADGYPISTTSIVGASTYRKEYTYTR